MNVKKNQIDIDSNAWLLLENDVFADCNQSTLDIFKCSDKQSIIGKSPYDFSPETQPDGESSKNKAIRKIKQLEGNEIVQFEWVHKNRDGDLFSVIVHLEKIRQLNKDYVYAQLFSNQKALKLSKKKSRKIDEFKYIRNIVTGLAHQINTPLGNIFTILSLMKTNQYIGADDPYLPILESSIDRLKLLVHEIQNSSFVSQCENYNWIDAKTLSRCLNLHFHNKYDLPIYQEPFEIQGLENITFKCYLLKTIEVMERIIINSFEHNPDCKPELVITARQENPHLILEIKNDGKPVPMEIRDFMFDPFVTENPGKHLGLGLFIVKNIVRFLLKGHINLRSNDEQTVFTIKWPCEIKVKSESIAI